MPIHDWTRVSAGTWHAFLLGWISELQNALNGGVLPAEYYAMAEQIAGPLGPDVLALETASTEECSESANESSGGIALAVAPPLPKLVGEAEAARYLPKRRTLVIRHASGDRIVALIELVSPGNKSSRSAWRSFVEKAVDAIHHGYHLLIIDLFPPGVRDPQGVHAAIWSDFSDADFLLPPDAKLTLAAYSAGAIHRAYVENTAVGRSLIDMPLFLEPEIYVNVPLEATYQAAYRGVPQRWKSVLESIA